MAEIVPATYGEFFDRGDIIGIEKMSVTYVKSADTNSSSDENQYLTITTQQAASPTLLDAEEEQSYYFDISTEKWSIENPEDLLQLVEDFKQRIYNNPDKVQTLLNKGNNG